MRATDILDGCMQASADAGLKAKVSYVVIADDVAGGLFEDVQIPVEGDTSGPETRECVMERMLGATLPAPPSDIDRFTFEVSIELILRDAALPP